MQLKEILLSWGMLVVSVIINVYGVFVIKTRMNELGKINVDSWKETFYYGITICRYPSVIIGLILIFVAPFLFAIALSRMEMSIAYPVQIVLSLVMLLLLSVLFLGERIDMTRSIAIILAITCVYLLSRK